MINRLNDQLLIHFISFINKLSFQVLFLKYYQILPLAFIHLIYLSSLFFKLINYIKLINLYYKFKLLISIFYNENYAFHT